MSRPRAVCYTLNNPTEEELTQLRALFANKDNRIRYHVFQLEAGALGTRHAQGYISAFDAKVFATWKRLIGQRAHIEAAKGDAASNKAYCSKDSDRIPGTLVYEEGEIPQPGKRNDVLALAEDCENPALSMREVYERNRCSLLRFPKAGQLIRSLVCEPRAHKTLIYWFYGSTGTGKSYEARKRAPNAYWKSTAAGKWWDGYDPLYHEDVVIDDYRYTMCDFDELLRMFDENPFSVECKGGTSVFRPRRIFVSTPKSPESTWSGRVEEELLQLLRRIEVIIEFCPGRVKRLVKGSPTDLVPDAPVGSPERPRATSPLTQETLIDSDSETERDHGPSSSGGRPTTERRVRTRFIVESDSEDDTPLDPSSILRAQANTFNM